MKFKNYKNKYTNDNVIHSIEDVIGMPFGDVVNREPELESQYRQIGLPTNSELNSSPNAVYVNAYTRDDGTQVSAHWRSKPEGRVNGVNSSPIPEQIQSGINVPNYDNGIFGGLNNNTSIPNYNDETGINNIDVQTALAPLLVPLIFSQQAIQQNAQPNQNITTGFATDVDTKQTEDFSNNPYFIQANISKSNFGEGLKDFLYKYVKPYRDYEGLNSIEKAQKWASKHTPWWTPSEYYGISEYLADNGTMPEKYKKNNEYYKLGDIADNRTKEIITKKVIKARQDCPVGPYTNNPLDDVDVIVPKADSELVQKVKRSDEIKKFIEDNRSRLEAGETINGSINFEKPQFDKRKNENFKSFAYRKNEETGRFTAIHYADIVDAKMNKDGTITMKLVDYYDFTRLSEQKYNLSKIIRGIKNIGIGNTAKNILNNSFNVINNRAYEQQKLGKLKPYAVYFEFTL